MGFSFKRGLVALGTGGASEVARSGYKALGGKKSPNELLFGSGPKDITSENERAGIDEGVTAQRSALKGLMGSTATMDSLKPTVELEKKAIAQSAQDTLKKLRDLRSSRGQVGTSLGMGTESGIMNQSSLMQGQLAAGMNERLRQMQRQEGMQNIQAASPLAQRERLMTEGTKGIASALGMIGGGVIGGPLGATMGGAGGSALSGMFGG